MHRPLPLSIALIGSAVVLAGFTACGGIAFEDDPYVTSDPGDSGVVRADAGTLQTSKKDASSSSASDSGGIKRDAGSTSSFDAGSVTTICAGPPVDMTACTTDADCTLVLSGCYCGSQPVRGVAVGYAGAVASCEDVNRQNCALDCDQGAGFVTEMSNQVLQDIGDIRVACWPYPGGGGQHCVTMPR